MTNIFEVLGVVLGLTGSVFNSLKTNRSRRRSFQIWLVSNTLLIALSIKLGAYLLAGMYLWYCVTNAIGWYNNRKEIHEDH